ncbi:MAG: dual specificity protein phosphatase [Desulfobacterium sp.]|jgi:protein-tyrosine phosphatase|nr:dual specificity protein phosphatase [Desulfobacterium sp.]
MPEYELTWITDSIALGSAPTSYGALDFIKAQKINAIVNLCAEFSDLHELEQNYGFEVYHLPIWDEDIPAMDEMEKALAWLDEAIYLGKKVLVHCRHGIGRTGTFITSYMIRRGLNLKSAKKKLKCSRANPTNYCQWKLLKQYGKRSGTLKIREASLEMKKRVDLSRFFSDYRALVEKMTSDMEQQILPNQIPCGKGVHTCCKTRFELSFIEVVYFYSKTNQEFTSAQRERLIQKAAAVSKKKEGLCPLNNGAGCEIYDDRPVRCRFYGSTRVPSPGDLKILTELSRTIFLALSGQFLPDQGFNFSVADTISGKFVQKYFQHSKDTF